MVIKHQHNKNLLVMVLIYLMVCTIPYFRLIPKINWGINAETQQEPPIAVPLLPPQTAEVRQPPTPHPVATPIPIETPLSEPESPRPLPDFRNT